MVKILVVEDDTAFRAFLAEVIKKNFKAMVFEASNGEIALQRLESTNIDLVFLDIAMPIMNGYEFLKNVRANKRIKKLPVIILSANNERDLVGDLITLGIHDYMIKPLDYNVVKERIKKTLKLLGLLYEV